MFNFLSFFYKNHTEIYILNCNIFWPKIICCLPQTLTVGHGPLNRLNNIFFTPFFFTPLYFTPLYLTVLYFLYLSNLHLFNLYLFTLQLFTFHFFTLHLYSYLHLFNLHLFTLHLFTLHLFTWHLFTPLYFFYASFVFVQFFSQIFSLHLLTLHLFIFVLGYNATCATCGPNGSSSITYIQWGNTLCNRGTKVYEGKFEHSIDFFYTLKTMVFYLLEQPLTYRIQPFRTICRVVHFLLL